MKRVHQFSGRILLYSGGLLALIFIVDWGLGIEIPVLIPNLTFAVFGLSLAVFAYTFKRWINDPVPGPQDSQMTDKEK